MAAGNEFQVAIVTPEALVLETTAAEVQFPAYDGFIGVLNHRAPLLTKLGGGLLTLNSATDMRRFVISGGYAQMKDNVLTILTDEACAEDAATPEKLAAAVAQGRATRNQIADTIAQRAREAAPAGDI